MAIENGNVLVAKELLSHNAEVQIKFTFGAKSDTAFHAAARRRDVDLLRLLAEHGAQVDARNVKKSTKDPRRMNITSASTYLQAEGQTALHIAASEGDENVVKYLHILHANPNINGNQ